MGISSFFRNLVGAASKADLDAAAAAAASARDARAAAEEMKALVARTREELDQQVVAVQGELARLSARVESMPEMRAQLEGFVQSLGRTMVQAAERLDTVDDRLHHMEQQARAQTEVLSVSRSELDRQGRMLGALEPQMKSLEEAVVRLAAASERTETMVREFDGRALRTSRAERVAIAAAAVAVVAVLVALVRVA